VYRKLLTVKRKNESFSELFDRLTESRAPLETLKKLRETLEFTEPEKNDLLAEIRSKRAERRK
jgi:predicted CopG family antitoxin